MTSTTVNRSTEAQQIINNLIRLGIPLPDEAYAATSESEIREALSNYELPTPLTVMQPFEVVRLDCDGDLIYRARLPDGTVGEGGYLGLTTLHRYSPLSNEQRVAQAKAHIESLLAQVEEAKKELTKLEGAE